MHFKHLSFSSPYTRQPTERNPWYPDCEKLNVGLPDPSALGFFLSIGLPFIYSSVPAFLSLFIDIVFLKEMGLNGCVSCGVSHGWILLLPSLWYCLTGSSALCPVNWQLDLKAWSESDCFFLLKLLPRWCFVSPLGGMYASYLGSGHLFTWSAESFWHDPRSSWFLVFLWQKNYLEKRLQVLGVPISLGHFK